MAAGAIGCYVGGCLAAEGADVVFVGRERTKKELEASGLVLSALDGASGRVVPKERVIFGTEASALAKCDVVLCCVKSAQTAEAAREARRGAEISRDRGEPPGRSGQRRRSSRGARRGARRPRRHRGLQRGVEGRRPFRQATSGSVGVRGRGRRTHRGALGAPASRRLRPRDAARRRAAPVVEAGHEPQQRGERAQRSAHRRAALRLRLPAHSRGLWPRRSTFCAPPAPDRPPRCATTASLPISARLPTPLLKGWRERSSRWIRRRDRRCGRIWRKGGPPRWTT